MLEHAHDLCASARLVSIANAKGSSRVGCSHDLRW
jgi:hypothetical protein